MDSLELGFSVHLFFFSPISSISAETNMKKLAFHVIVCLHIVVSTLAASIEHGSDADIYLEEGVQSTPLEIQCPLIEYFSPEYGRYMKDAYETGPQGELNVYWWREFCPRRR